MQLSIKNKRKRIIFYNSFIFFFCWGVMSGKEIIQTKLVFLGEAAVGKSSIVLRFVKDEFSLGSESTIGGM